MHHLPGEDKRPVVDEWENGPAKRQRMAPGSNWDSNSGAADPEFKVDESAADLIAPAAPTVISDGTESSEYEDDDDSSVEFVAKSEAPTLFQSNAAASTTVAEPEPEPESVLWHLDPDRDAPPRWHTPIMHYTDVSKICSLKMVNPERSYRLWRDANGRLESTFGALIPEGYALWNNPSYPWICPVRDCRRLCASRQALGGHFIRHRKSLLNDNRDGTFTVVGTYAEQLLGERGLPAVVIAQKPGNTAPMEVPSEHVPPGPGNGALSAISTLPSESLLPPVAKNGVPFYRRQVDPSSGIVHPQPPKRIVLPNTNVAGAIPLRADSPQVRLKGKTPNMQLDAKGDFITPIPGDAHSMWEYIKGFMRQTPLPPSTGHVPDFIGLPRLRDIRWNQSWKNGYFESLPRDITALIMYLTGEYPPVSCTRCKACKGPFDGCIVTSRVVQNQTIVSCSNCWYHGFQTQCTLRGYLSNRSWMLRSRGPDGTSPAASPGATSPATATVPARITTAAQTPVPIYISGVHNSTSGQSQCVQASVTRTNPTPVAQQPAPQTTNTGQSTISNNKPTSSASAISEQRRITTRSSSSAVATNQPSPAISANRAPGNIQTQTPAEALDMEGWEVGPGRIRSKEDDGESIAFSNAYLFGSNGSSVAVADGISFHVDVIRPGTRRTFERDSATTRICSLASGKLKVRMQGEDELTLGTNGMFKIRPGVACTVENRIYLDCILHVSSVVTEDVGNTDE